VGRIVEKSDDELVLVIAGKRQVIPLADVVSIRRPQARARISDGKAFGIGAAVGAAILTVVVCFAYFGH
jgi:hypothetical protein